MVLHFNFPGAIGTYANGVNASGQVVVIASMPQVTMGSLLLYDQRAALVDDGASFDFMVLSP